MTFSTQILTTAFDCNALIEIAKKEKADMVFQKISLERHKEVTSGNAGAVDVALATITSQISSLESTIAGLPDGDTKIKEGLKLMSLNVRKAKLMYRKSNQGVVDILETEFELDRVDKEISSADLFIQALTDRLNGL